MRLGGLSGHHFFTASLYFLWDSNMFHIHLESINLIWAKCFVYNYNYFIYRDKSWIFGTDFPFRPKFQQYSGRYTTYFLENPIFSCVWNPQINWENGRLGAWTEVGRPRGICNIILIPLSYLKKKKHTPNSFSKIRVIHTALSLESLRHISEPEHLW